jgi:hypothetical protein
MPTKHHTSAGQLHAPAILPWGKSPYYSQAKMLGAASLDKLMKRNCQGLNSSYLQVGTLLSYWHWLFGYYICFMMQHFIFAIFY